LTASRNAQSPRGSIIAKGSNERSSGSRIKHRCPGLLAAAGKDGKDGATGPRGERGEHGLIGPRGEPAPSITGWRVDCVAYAGVPLLSDGSEGAPLELRGLFKQFLDEVAPHR
jgi:hypothetical protein